MSITDFLNELRLKNDTTFIVTDIITYDNSNDFANIIGAYTSFNKAYEAALLHIANIDEYAKKPMMEDSGTGIYIEHRSLDEEDNGCTSKTYILPLDKHEF